MTDTDRPLSERLAFALSTLYAAADLAGQRHPTTGQPACPQALREAARAYAQVADEADGIADPQIAALTARAEKAEAEASKWYKAAADGIDAMGEHGRGERDRLVAQVAELEAALGAKTEDCRAATERAAHYLDERNSRTEAWQRATGCEDPGEVRVLSPSSETLQAIVMPRDAAGGPADIAAWQTATGCTDPASVRVLTEEMPLARQTCPQCDAPEIHCAGCGTATSTAWTCAKCSMGGDAGREADRLRGAVVEAADRWTEDSDPDATRYETRAANLMRAVRALRTHRTQPVKP